MEDNSIISKHDFSLRSRPYTNNIRLIQQIEGNKFNFSSIKINKPDLSQSTNGFRFQFKLLPQIKNTATFTVESSVINIHCHVYYDEIISKIIQVGQKNLVQEWSFGESFIAVNLSLKGWPVLRTR